MNIFDVNWIAVVVAALAGFLVGGIWYGPIMGKTWMGAVGLTEEQIKQGSMGKIYGGAFAFSLIASWTLASTPVTGCCSTSPWGPSTRGSVNENKEIYIGFCCTSRRSGSKK